MSDELYEAIMGLTGTKEWETLTKSLEADLANYRLNIERVNDLLELGRLQGKIQATETFVQLREVAKAMKNNAV